MTVLMWPRSSGGLAVGEGTIEGIGGEASQTLQARHIDAPRNRPPFPAVPDLARRSDAPSRRLKRQLVPQPPLPKGVIGSVLGHTSRCKLYPYHLTSIRKGLNGSIVSAEILQLVPMEDLPNRIRALRMAAMPRMSQQALGDQIGVSKMTISDLERGEIELTLDYMRRISRALGVLPSDLLLPHDNPEALNAEERALIERLRSATTEERETLHRVTDAILSQKHRDAA